MRNLVKTLVCRPVYGFTLNAAWSDTEPPQIVRYEILLPSGAVLPFRRAALGAALKTFHVSTDVWFWFTRGYRLCPVFKDDQSDTVLSYTITGQTGQVFESSGSPDGLLEALTEFEQVTGVDITADDAMAEYFESPCV